jgi:hypothetical protein
MEKKVTNEEILAALEIMDKKLNLVVNVMLKANEELTKEGVVKDNA